MKTLADFFGYLEQKAVQHADIPHDPANGKVAFHAIDDPYDLESFDNALRNSAAFPAMLAEHHEGMLDDSESANYVDTWDGGFMIIDKRIGKEPVHAVRDRCMKIGKAIIIQMRKDGRPPVGDPPADGIRLMGVKQIGYTPVGPMLTQYWGYLFTFRFICPFSF